VRGASGSALTGALQTDLVVAGALTRPIAGHFRLECRWWSSIEAAPGPFLLARHAWGAQGSVVMLLRDLSAASARLLEAAAQIAETADRLLTVICQAAVPGAGVETWVIDRLAGHPVRLQVEIAPPEPAALHQRISELDCRCLAVAAAGAEGNGNRLRELVERFGCDILMVGEE